MQMTDAEVVSSYRFAKDKINQIQVLSELNLVPRATIEKILLSSGVELPEKKRRRRRLPTAGQSRESPIMPKVPPSVLRLVNARKEQLEKDTDTILRAKQKTALNDEIRRVEKDMYKELLEINDFLIKNGEK